MCKFCDYSGEVLWENERVFVILGRPHHKGHTEVVLKEHHEALSEIGEALMKEFFYDAFRVSQVVKEVLRPEKLNFELLGNWVPHLHWHIIPRFKEDEDFGNPPCIPNKDDHYKKIELSEEEIAALKRGFGSL
jgi:diadenosine tetraphosphate (Ap4A) HIT family hydrolase